MIARQPQRIAYFAGSYEHVLDGVVLTCNRQVAHLEANGAAVRVYAPTNGKPLLKPAGDFIPVPSIGVPGNPYRLALGLSRGIRRNLEQFNPDVVHLATPDWLGASALRWARQRCIPVLATFHTRFASYLRHYRLGCMEPLCWRFIRWFYGRCDRVFVSCESTAAELREHGVAAPLTVVPMGVDIARFAPRHRSDEWRARHGIAPGDCAVLFVGRLVREKGLAAFTRTVRLLEDRGTPPKILIVGDGPERSAFRRGLPRATFTGVLSGEELSVAYASSDVFFFPSDSESFGCVTLEALASGLPCVVANAPGSRDLVRHGREGLVCEPGRADAFAWAIRLLSENPALRQTMADMARKRAGQFHWPTILDNVRSLTMSVQRQAA